MSDAIHAGPAIDAAAAPGPFDAADAAGRNAVTHGLTARRPLHEEEAERMSLIADHWARQHHPETEPEEALIHSAAIEYVRYLRCVEAEEARLGPATREALDAWRETKRHAIRRKAQGLRDEPGRVAAELHESAFGIDWMLRHWRELLGHLDAGRGWSGDDLATAQRLTGRDPGRPAVADVDVDARRFWEAATAACPATDDPEAAPGLADAGAADRLRALVAERIARLEALRPVVWEEVEAAEVRSVERDALSDVSKDGQLRQRYRREAFRDWQKSLSLIMRLKVERSRIAERDSRCERREQGTRPWSGWARTAAAPASSPVVPPPPSAPPSASVPPPSAPVDSRNEPPSAPESTPTDRRNPNPGHGLQPGTGAGEPGDPRRTGARTEAHQGPDACPGAAPRGVSEGPGRGGSDRHRSN